MVVLYDYPKFSEAFIIFCQFAVGQNYQLM